MKLRIINKKEFNDFCKTTTQENFFQSKGWTDFKRSDGYNTYYLGLDESGKILAAAVLLSQKTGIFGNKIFYSPSGLIVDYKNNKLVEDFNNHLIEFLKREKTIYLRISPNIILRQRDKLGNIIEGGENNTSIVKRLEKLGYVEVEKEYYKAAKFLYKLSLHNKNIDELFNNFSYKIQEIIQTNETIGITNRTLKKEEFPTFIKLLQINKKGTRYISFNNSNYKKLFEILDNQKMLNLTITELDIDKYLESTNQSIKNCKDEKLLKRLKEQLEQVNLLKKTYNHKIIISGTASIIYDKEITTILNFVNDNFINFNPLYNTYYNNIEFAKENDLDTYNFYGITGNFNKDRLFEFYKEFNGYVVELLGEFDLVFNERLYRKEMKKLEK